MCRSNMPYNIHTKGKETLELKAVTMIDPITGSFEIMQYNDKKMMATTNSRVGVGTKKATLRVGVVTKKLNIRCILSLKKGKKMNDDIISHSKLTKDVYTHIYIFMDTTTKKPEIIFMIQ